MPGPVSATLTAKWLFAVLALTRISPVSVNLMALPTRLSKTWVRRCSSPTPMGRGLATSILSASFLFCASGSVADRNGLDNALDGVFGHIQGELAGLDLGDVEHGVDEAEQVP